MKLSRRDFMKANAVAAAAAVAGSQRPTLAANLITSTDKTAITWDKAPCRFCGTGCSVLVGSQAGRVVATQGDPDAPVNRGLNCIKGYFLSKIMYGEDRLTQPMLRMTNGKFDKNGDFAPISWDQAFDIMAEKFKATLKEKGPTAVGMFGSGQWTVWGRLCRRQADESGPAHQQPGSQRPSLHGLRRGRFHAYLRHG